MNEFLGMVGNSKDPKEKQAQREAFIKQILPRYMNYLVTRVKMSGGPFILGKRISIADLLAYGQLNLLYTGFIEGIPVDFIAKNYPEVDRIYKEIEKHPIVQAELNAKRKGKL